ncbi:Env [Simian immunodeficiency virus]|uniref:Envelope glycoprotein gp160 n=1 Tax=Simian immunodeficiency virus TaxID=11723 RepID=A0A075E7D3_SIV|nr:Env [Simian immunodeficiency virus]
MLGKSQPWSQSLDSWKKETVAMKKFLRTPPKNLGILLLMLLTILPLSSEFPLPKSKESTEWTTVFYGVPVWKDAKPPLFCASDVNIASTRPGNIWIATACLPTDPSPQEVVLNISEYFDIYKNYMVDEVTDDIRSIFNQAYKPCVKLTPMCVRMACVLQKENKTAINTTTANITTTAKAPTTPEIIGGMWNRSTGQGVYNCSFNQTTEFRDKTKQMYSLFYVDDVMSSQNGNVTEYYITNCNTTAITQSCEKAHFDPVPIHYCAPAGYTLLKCNDANFTGQGMCHNVSAVHCTHGILPLVATWFQLNGTLQPGNDTAVVMNGKKNESVVIRLGENYKVNLTCIRPGNKTIRNLQIGAGMTFYSQLIVGGDTRRAYCKIDKTQWDAAIRQSMIAMRDHWIKINKNDSTHNYTKENITIRWISQPKGDPEVQTHWFACDGEFFYCNLSALFQFENNVTEINSGNIDNVTSKYKENQWMTCKIKQFVTQWGFTSKSIYLPPKRGHIQCTSNITGLLIEGAMYRDSINMTPSANVMDAWRAELSRYKVVEIDPLSVAPTRVPRREAPRLHTRAISLGITFLTFLSAAGGTMGSAAIALTVQSRSLLAGIVQQQQNLLRAVQTQQHLLQLSVWGIKQLQARMTAIEKYLRDQTLLNSWGCANRAICHTNLPWNKSWANETMPGWDNMTWQEWSRLIDNDTVLISNLLEEAEKQQERNNHDLMKLAEWDSLWSWFDISHWLWYIKIFIIIVAALVGLRILMWLIGILRRVREGYSLVSPQNPIHPQEGQRQPEGIKGDVGDGGNVKSVRLLNGFLACVWNDLRDLIVWIYQTLRSSLSTLVWAIQESARRIWTLLNRLWQTLREQAARLREVIRRIIAYLQYGLQELQEAATGFLDALAIFTWNWTEAVLQVLRRVAREFLAIPRRIRQGAEILFN